MNYKTPGVYVEEVSLFPPSVAQVETAIPAFIGYTEKVLDDDGKTISEFPHIKRIKSLIEYEYYFGKTISQPFKVDVGDVNGEFQPKGLIDFTPSKYLMYYALQMFFANGGGPCYIVVVDKQVPAEDNIDLGELAGDGVESGLLALKKKDEPTLLIFPDAVSLPEDKYTTVVKNGLNQCKALGDRFMIMDIHDGAKNSATKIAKFRTDVGTNYLNYGAAYTPYLNTNLNYYSNDSNTVFKNAPVPRKLNGKVLSDIKAVSMAIDFQKIVDEKTAATKVVSASRDEVTKAAILAAQASVDVTNTLLEAAKLTNIKVSEMNDEFDKAIASLTKANDAAGESVDATAKTKAKAAADEAKSASDAAIGEAPFDLADLTEILKIFNPEFENKLKTLLNKQYITMPPSSAIAGVYASVDRTRGVWKAPANVSLNNVIAPSAKITDQDQEGLNIHESGKSINAIRSFTGKGIMVWGARTLAGNDNEWRYISVRRFYNMVEESVKKATEPFVFEPNDANTWVKVRAMIENFLTLQWRAGALAGAVPEDAFYVKVGLGQTMTAVDVLEGRMIVEIGMAVVRPAEFIILRFSHKLQES